MAIGERIKFIRNLRGMTQKYLGMSIGFDDKTADVRIAQYESGTRTPKGDLTNALAEVLEVSPQALDVPDIESEQGFMHTLFALEDLYGLKVELVDGEAVLRVDSKGTTYPDTSELVSDWAEQATKFKAGEIAKEEYDKWRYNYPKYDAMGHWHIVPSQELSDAMADAFKDKLK